MQLLSVPELAKFLRVPRSWVYSAIQQKGAKRLPHYRVGKHLRFDLDAVVTWMKGQTDAKMSK